MTTDNKYYTPDISEFHVGFEFEQLDHDYQGQNDGKEWKKIVFNKENLEETLRYWKHYQEYRVPYLSHDDIVAEGWKINENGIYYIGNSEKTYEQDFVLHKNTSGYDITKQFHMDNGRRYLHLSVKFCGTILNRSELRFQMKRIGITV